MTRHIPANPPATFSPSQLKLGDGLDEAAEAVVVPGADLRHGITGRDFRSIAVRPQKSPGSTAASLRIEDDRDFVPFAASLIEMRRLRA
jgi:hypothetical protein